MENPKRYADKIKRKDGGNNSGLQIPAGSYNMMASLSIIKPLFEPHFKSIHSYSAWVHPKLEISQPEDISEVQADELADSVMEGDVDQSQEVLSQNTSDVFRSGEGGAMQTSTEFDQQLQNTKGQGQKLDENTKSELEEHTGTDLSGVNIHTDAQAHGMSESINAKAFAHGQDIYFNEGNYNPGSEEGKSLLAHEVAHVVQDGVGVNSKINRAPGVNKDLESVWFKGIKKLEDALDGVIAIERPDSGPHVKRIQQALLFLGIDIGPERDDGNFGEGTQAGVITLQQIWGANVQMESIDGIVGEETMAELDRIFKKTKLPKAFKIEQVNDEVKSTSAQILEALENDVGTRINNFGRIGAKQENYDEIKDGLGKKIFEEPEGDVSFRLKYNATVTIFGEHKNPVNKGWIYIYSPELDKAGWVQRPYVEYAPTPNAELYFVQEGDMLKDVVRKHYTNIPDDLNDARLLVNAVAMVNGGMEGLVYNIPVGEEKTNWLSRNLLSEEGVQAQAIWNSVVIKKGHNIWLPSVTEIQVFKDAGILVPGSVTQEYWEGFISVLKFIGGVVAGFFEGLWMGFTDLFEGIWELLKAIWFQLTASLTEKLASYIKIALALKQWWDKLDVMHELKLLWNKLMYHSTPFEQGEFFGKIIGYLVFQIILIESGALIAAVIKWMARLLSEAGELVASVFRAAKLLPEVKTMEKPKLTPADKPPIKNAVEEGKADPVIEDDVFKKRKAELDKDFQTGVTDADSISEADTILTAEKNGIVENARRPKAGEPNLDFVIDGPPPYKYADVKTPIKPKYETVTKQMQNIINKIRLYDKNVLGVIDLKNLSVIEKVEAMKVIDSATDLTNITVLNK